MRFPCFLASSVLHLASKKSQNRFIKLDSVLGLPFLFGRSLWTPHQSVVVNSVSKEQFLFFHFFTYFGGKLSFWPKILRNERFLYDNSKISRKFVTWSIFVADRLIKHDGKKMSATFFCYIRLQDILFFYAHDNKPELDIVKCKGYFGVICKNLWVTSFFYICEKITENAYF